MRLHRVAASLAAALLLFAACGDDDDSADTGSTPAAESDGATDPSTDDSDGDDSDGDGDEQSSADTSVTITVDGVTYPMTTVQTCETERTEERSQDLAVYGFAEQGTRVELSFSYQAAADSPTGTEQFYGQINVAAEDISAQTTADELFEFLDGDRSNVSGELTMTNTSDERDVAVEFDITCP